MLRKSALLFAAFEASHTFDNALRKLCYMANSNTVRLIGLFGSQLDTPFDVLKFAVLIKNL